MTYTTWSSQILSYKVRGPSTTVGILLDAMRGLIRDDMEVRQSLCYFTVQRGLHSAETFRVGFRSALLRENRFSIHIQLHSRLATTRGL